MFVEKLKSRSTETKEVIHFGKIVYCGAKERHKEKYIKKVKKLVT